MMYLQTESMWGWGGIGGRPDYASDLGALNLKTMIVASFR